MKRQPRRPGMRNHALLILAAVGVAALIGLAPAAADVTEAVEAVGRERAVSGERA